MSPGERLRLLRQALRHRDARRSRTDVGYTVYVFVLSVVLVCYPLVRAAAMALSAPGALAALSSPSVPIVGAACLGMVGAALVWAGRVFGPVTLEPALVHLLAGTDVPRHRGLLRPFVLRAAACVGVAAVFGMVLAGVLVAAEKISVPTAAMLVVTAAFLAVIGSVLWLAGQALAERAAWTIGLTVIAVGLGIAMYFAGEPASTRLSWMAGDGPPILSISLAAASAATCVAVRPLLDRLRGPALIGDAIRWRSIGHFLLSGEIHSGLGSLRARARVGRNWRSVTAAPAPVRFFVADLVAAWRTPGRLLTGAGALILSWAMVAVAPTVPASLPLAGIGAVTGFLAVGTAADGLRHAVATAAHPPVYGLTTGRLVAMHTLFPLTLVMVTGAIGCWLSVSLGLGVQVLTVALLGAMWVAVRAWSAAKGHLPVWLLTPVITPVGDVSSMNIVVWQADAPIASVIIALCVVALVQANLALPAVGVTMLSVGMLLLWLRRRLERL